MADILERELAKASPLKITGNVSNEDRNKIVDIFNKDSSRRILIMTGAGVYGLNIQVASVIIHYDSEWSLAKLIQREGRAHRYGQKETVLVYNLIAKNTIDEYVKKVLHSKSELSADVLGDRPITMGDIEEMLV